MMAWETNGDAVEGGSMWAGRSGRQYMMTRVDGDRTFMAAARLYALAERGVIRWAGTAQDLIGDYLSRERFRRLNAQGAQMLTMPSPADPLALMTLAWDLEGGHVIAGRDAA